MKSLVTFSLLLTVSATAVADLSDDVRCREIGFSKSVEMGDAEKFVSYLDADASEHSITADRIVNGAGRIANVANLDLDAAGVAHDRIRIEVDEHLRSVSNPARTASTSLLIATTRNRRRPTCWISAVSQIALKARRSSLSRAAFAGHGNSTLDSGSQSANVSFSRTPSA